ncbi:hypothetical protein LROSRS0_0416 [Furfurilactobacillus rossiae]|nr:hypothetical protein LROSRS0_0416 [Furfurilactobacillus rossiae]
MPFDLLAVGVKCWLLRYEVVGGFGAMAEEKDIHFMSEDELKQHWREYASGHVTEFIDPLFDSSSTSEWDSISVLKPKKEQGKLAIFTAGTPGSGKSELIDSLYEEWFDQFVHIDADDFRTHFPDYNGSNAAVYQKGANWLVDRAFKRALKESRSFILEGTFNAKSSIDDVRRAVSHEYATRIEYTYLEPEIAWKFVLARAEETGRTVPKEAFKRAFLGIPKQINEVLNAYGDQIEINLYVGLPKNRKTFHGTADVLKNLPDDIDQQRLEDITNGK